MKTRAEWPWSDELDAVVVAPDSHIVLLENESVRVLQVVLAPGQKEPFHTHKLPSVFILTKPALLRYYDETKKPAFDTQERSEADMPETAWVGPEGLHAVENIDDKVYEAFRIELKN